MRTLLPLTLITLMATATLLMSFPLPTQAEDAAAAIPAPDTIARWIRAGGDADLTRAATAASKLDAPSLRKVFAAIQNQDRVHASLEKKRVRGLVWEEATLEVACSYLRTITGYNFYVTPRARDHAKALAINLQIDDASIATVLDLITSPYELQWQVRGDMVWIGTAKEFAMSAPISALGPVVKKDLAAEALRAKIKQTTISIDVEEQSLPDVVKTVQIQTGFNIVLDPRLAADAANTTVSKLKLVDAPLEALLNMLTGQTGDEDLVWTVKGNVIFIGPNAK